MNATIVSLASAPVHIQTPVMLIVISIMLAYLVHQAITSTIDPNFYLFFRNRWDSAYVRDIRLARGRVHGPVLTLFGRLWWVIGADAAKWMLVQQKAGLFSGEEAMRPRFKDLFQNSLLAQDGPTHTFTRRLLTPAFKLNALQAYLPRITRMTSSEFHHLATSKAPYIDLQSEIRQLTLRIAFTLLLGADIPEDEHQLSPGLVKRYEDLTRGFLPWPFSSWDARKKSKLAKQRVLKDVEEVIHKRLTMVEEGIEPAEIDPLWLLMKSRDEDGNRLSVEQLASQALLLVLAGHLTTAATLSSFVAVCLQNPSLLNWLKEEQDSFLPADTKTTIFTPAESDLRNMPRLQSTLREVERVYPVAQLITRKTKHAITYSPPDGGAPVTIPANTHVSLDIVSTNRDPSTYTNPDAFDPQRWMAKYSDESTIISNFALATFGAGHRACLGMQFARMEMGVVASMLVREFEWEGKEGIRLERVPLPIMRWRDGLWVSFKERVKG